ncbi:MAG: LemA family protein [Candidatus ainarchaeum sp.]|nr:LemA family protein [Candidatus ainarchaeum sp.]MDD3976075.1 LemA family protein [Candidatus ainarchaeum sp.]
MAIWLIVLLVLIGLFLIIILTVYNGLIRLRNRVKNAWSQIDVQLKKRYDLLPNLIETVKGYMKHEASTFQKITELRSQAMNAKDQALKVKANNELTNALGQLKVAFENYPDLKASQNFLMLQEELSGIENKIAFARQFYNDSVMIFNNKIEMFPSNIIANMFNFDAKEFFEAPELEKKNIKVSF